MSLEQKILTGQPIKSGRARELSFKGLSQAIDLPEGLSGSILEVDECSGLSRLPANLQYRRIEIEDCPNLKEIGPGLHCDFLSISSKGLERISHDLSVSERLDLRDCENLRSLPENLRTGTLNLSGCTSLETLPEGIECHFLSLDNCASFRSWPRRGSIRFGHVSLRNCTELTYLPSWLGPIARLDVRDCSQLRELPQGLQATSWIDTANSGIEKLPDSLSNCLVRWQGVLVHPRIVFQPETITIDEILNEVNVEVRRVMIQRMGYSRFIEDASAETLDCDKDAGGERRLLRVPIKNDEALVCVSVICPSTGHQYMLRVPPHITSCRKAVAWIAGFENPNDYQLIRET